jgi:hypothetical protein
LLDEDDDIDGLSEEVLSVGGSLLRKGSLVSSGRKSSMIRGSNLGEISEFEGPSQN